MNRIGKRVRILGGIPENAPVAAAAGSNLFELLADAYFGPRELAERFGVPSEALRKRLERWRKQNGEGWREVPDPKRGEARVVYKVGAVRAVLEDMQRSDATSGVRPPKKK